MLKIYLPFLFCFFLFSQCQSAGDEEPASGEIDSEKGLTGEYEGFKVFDKSSTDSLQVSLKLDWISEHEMKLEELKPFNHIKQIRMNGMEFTYDRGIGEDDCGVISMKGTGVFKGKNLYVIETIHCVKNNGPDRIIEYRVTKK